MEKVSVWQEEVLPPTYPALAAEKNPMFLEKRAYQGSTGKVYPLPVTEQLSDEKQDVAYKAVFLENEYLKVMILPELGGRIHRAYDKTNHYDFVYYNHVVKPALVGLTGPWISGGIKFNWPQHHRPSTYFPVDFTFAQNPDGSCTVYLSEIDKMYGTKGTAAISLYPGKAYIEIAGRLYNPTDLPQTFLWWANPAVPVNDNTYSVLPPDVNAVMDHGKRAVSTFPIATGEYYKYDYSAGVDISRYKNVPVPTSYMAAHSDFDFVGNYDEGVGAGLLHIADHHVSPGKKQWTWGNGDFGRAWDRNLTDEDGPYIELMTGVFTDNQPDFTWLKPHEEKNFVQYFMPYKGVGWVSNATRDAVIGLAPAQGGALLKVYVTAPCEGCRIEVKNGEELLFSRTEDLSPLACFEAQLPAAALEKGSRVTVHCGGRLLAEYAVYIPELRPVPEPAEALKAPEELKSTEELYLAAQHLEQYRHATFEPEDYYREGLRRDATDIRLNDAYGMLLYRRGRFEESLEHFQAAVDKQTWRNPNPYHGECRFHLGLAQLALGREEEAYDSFFKATWSAETQSVGFYHLACLCAKKGEYEQALQFVETALIRNWHDMRARTLKAALLRLLGRPAARFLQESLAIDPLCMGCLYEQMLADGKAQKWKRKMRSAAHNYLTLALDYRAAGLWDDALRILDACTDGSPLLEYYKGSICLAAHRDEEAAAHFGAGEAACPDYCFPNRIEEIAILSDAISTLGSAPMACNYLADLLYDKKQYDRAVALWEKAVREKPGLAMAWRNLSIAYYNKHKDGQKALAAMEKACDPMPSARFLLEYDQLAARLELPAAKRLAVLKKHMELVCQRDDLFLRRITLLNGEGRWQEALEAIRGRKFHPWEGGEGTVSTQYRFALCQLAAEEIAAGSCASALELLEQVLVYPENLGEGKLPNVPDNKIHFLMGLAHRKAGDEAAARKMFQLAAAGDQTPQPVRYYNDQSSDFIFYQGLALRMLGRENAAKRAFHKLVSYGEKHLFDAVTYDFFAVSLPEIEVYVQDGGLRNRQYCNYLRALGHLGLGQEQKAGELLAQVTQKEAGHQGALEAEHLRGLRAALGL